MDLKEVCRTCLGSRGVMFPLFDEIDELVETWLGTAIELLEIFSFVPIYYKDNLPDHICANCLNEIQRAYSFMIKCQKSEMILKQLKELKVNVKKLKEIPNQHEFEGESNSKLRIVKEEPEEILDPYDYEDLIKDNEIESELKLNRIPPDFHMTFKNEPELNIEDMKCDDNKSKANEQLKCAACEKQFQSIDMFHEHTITDHIVENLCKLCKEEFDGSPLEHTVKHLSSNHVDVITHVNSSDLGEDLKKLTDNLQSTEKYCQHCSQNFTDLDMLNAHACPRVSANRSDNEEDMKIEDIEEKTLQSHIETEDSNELPDQCKICLKVFSHPNNLIVHMRTHTGERPFECEFCSEQSRLRIALRVHTERKHLNELQSKPKIQCSICLKMFASKNHLVCHMCVHTGEIPFQCELCLEKFRFKSSLVKHIQSMHIEKVTNDNSEYQCSICSESFTTKSDLVMHMSSHADENPNFQIRHMKKKPRNESPDKPLYQCKVCSRDCRYKSLLIRHMRSHEKFQCQVCLKKFSLDKSLAIHMAKKHNNELNNELTCQCNICSTRFRYNSQLMKHMLCHTDDKPIQCKLCSENFRHKQLLRVHMETEHINELTIDKPKIQCSVCFKVFAYNCILKRQMRKHTIANLQCQICFEKFRNNRLLTIHMETKHINELLDAKSKHQCNMCWKHFRDNSSLIIHMRSHTGETPYKCELCCNSFRYKHLLRVHMETKHLNELPGVRKPKFQCNVCSKIFKFNHNLVCHMRRHTGEKPFQCEICLQKFRYRDSLLKHMQAKHNTEMIGNELNYQCNVCSKTYGYKMTLKIHMKTKHGKELAE